MFRMSIKNTVKGKSETLYKQLIYALATGQWKIGEKLPSVRQAEQKWNVNRLTVMAAYRRLEAAGLIESKGTSGYYVLESSEFDDLSRHQHELFHMYKRITELIQRESKLLPSTVLSCVTNIAHFNLKKEPEIAFVECSRYQANYHSNELENIIKMPVVPLSIDALSVDRIKLQTSIRCLITTGFHFEEVQEISEKSGLPLLKLVIEIDHQKLAERINENSILKIFEFEEAICSHIKSNVESLLDVEISDQCVDQHITKHLKEFISEDPSHQAILPPRVYDRIDHRLYQNSQVVPIDYRISKDSLTDFMSALRRICAEYIIEAE